MFGRDIWEFIKGNIFTIVLIVTLVIAVPWSLIFVLPIAVLALFLLVLLWRFRRAQQRMYEEARRQAGEQQYERQSHRSWWNKNREEGEITVVKTDTTEPRVSDDVGEYVDFKEIKDKDSN